MTRAEALVLAGHGSQHHPGTAAPLHAHADRIRDREIFAEVRTAFWKEEPSLRSVASTLGSGVAYVVPVLTSEGYFADRVFPRELGGEDDVAPVDLRYAEPVGTHDAMTEVVLERVEAVIEGPRADVGVALVGHGTDRHERSDRATREHARRIDDLDRYGDVRSLFLDEAPFVGDLFERLDASELAVVPLFVADGRHTTRDIPEAIGHPGVGETAEIDGRQVHYAGAVGTEPRLADLIVDRAADAGATIGTTRIDPTRGPAAGADAAFTAWVHGAEGRRSWGELAIGRDPDGFEIRHVEDVAVARARLEHLTDVPALRERVRRDDDGRYRPLSGERSLPSGWVLDGLDDEELARAIRAVYPGSIADWFHGRDGELPTTAFPETAGRQTGEYAELAAMEPAQVALLGGTVCGNCVRERAWAVDSAERVDADGGDGAIPCREACPFFLSAAVELGGAEGPVDDREDPDVPIAAFEDPGNRYRVRHAATRIGRRTAETPLTPGGDD